MRAGLSVLFTADHPSALHSLDTQMKVVILRVHTTEQHTMIYGCCTLCENLCFEEGSRFCPYYLHRDDPDKLLYCWSLYFLLYKISIILALPHKVLRIDSYCSITNDQNQGLQTIATNHFYSQLCNLGMAQQGKGFPGGSEGKDSAGNERDLDSIPESRRSPGERNANPLQYSCLEKSMDRGAWWATVHSVTRSKESTVQRIRHD